MVPAKNPMRVFNAFILVAYPYVFPETQNGLVIQ